MDWGRSYYRGIEHILWSPSELGLVRHVDSKGRLTQLMEKARRLENPLNHVLEIFFALAPSRFTLDVLGGPRTVTNLTSVQSGGVAGHEVSSKTFYGKMCQPDFFFVGDAFRACIEMKVGAGKSDLQQVLKYAILLNLYPHEDSAAGIKRLVLLGPKDFPLMWGKPRYQTIEELREGLATFNDAELARKLKPHGVSIEQAREWAAELQIGFTSYGDLHALAHKELALPRPDDEGSEVYRKLLKGLLIELERREYVSHGL